MDLPLNFVTKSKSSSMFETMVKITAGENWSITMLRVVTKKYIELYMI
jgi:hypothetical protein